MKKLTDKVWHQLPAEEVVQFLDQGPRHTLNVSKGTWAGSMEIEKRRLWLSVPRNFTAHLPC